MKYKKAVFAVIVSAFLTGCKGYNNQQIIINGKENESSVITTENSLVTSFSEATETQTVATKVEEKVTPTETQPPEPEPAQPVDVMTTEILYDGTHVEKITPDGDKTFSMGSETFNKGFTLTVSSYFNTDETIALFDLKEKYSYITFKAGRTNNSEIADVTLQVYLDGELSQEYSIDAKTPISSFEIPLNNAGYMQLKLKLDGSCYSYVPYGFAEVMLYPAE